MKDNNCKNVFFVRSLAERFHPQRFMKMKIFV